MKMYAASVLAVWSLTLLSSSRVVLGKLGAGSLQPNWHQSRVPNLDEPEYGILLPPTQLQLVEKAVASIHNSNDTNPSILQVELLEESTSDRYWPKHIFGSPKKRDMTLGFFGHHDRMDWEVLTVTTIVVILIEMLVVRPWWQSSQTSGMQRAGLVLLFWISIGLLFNVYVGMRHGFEDGIRWFNGYVLEWLLSMDNIFVFHLVFRIYKTPECLLHKALFWGIFGAIWFRMLFFIALGSLLQFMHWFRYVFGAFLIFSGIQAARDEEEDDDLESSTVVRALRWLLNDRMMPPPHYDLGGRLFVWQKPKDAPADASPKLQISMIVPVILCLEVTDILFAVDSVSAKVAQIPDQFVAYSSSVFAMFALRALFFIVEDLVQKLRLLKYGLCFILVFIGFELMLADYVQLPATAVCIVLVSVFSVCILLSFVFPDPESEQRT